MGAKLSVYTHMVPVKQNLRHMRIEWLLKIKEEVTKQLHVGFIKPVHQAEWIANVVPITKKDRNGRMCVDFRDLKKAYPKDNFPLPHIDVLVDNTAGSAFVVTVKKLLGFLVSDRGIEVNPSKINSILDMPPPKSENERKGFLGWLQYINRFIAKLTSTCESIFKLFRKNEPYAWNDKCQKAFEIIRQYLLHPPILPRSMDNLYYSTSLL